MSDSSTAEKTLLSPDKFRDPMRTAGGQTRASVDCGTLRTLWFNTGTLCNLTCTNCYIESSPTNDRLVYLTYAEVVAYLDEIAADNLGTEEIGFTGGEPFMNPDFIDMIKTCLERGFKVLVLTNAMRPMMKCADRLLAIGREHGSNLVLRISLDHYTETLHNLCRGEHAWDRAMEGFDWLVENDFTLNVAGRMMWSDGEDEMRRGFARMFRERGIPIAAEDTEALMLFPEMDETLDVPEITDECWGILGVAPEAMMCSNSRMVVKRKGEDAPVVTACTLLPYDSEFEMGHTLAEARRPVRLNHPHCSQFCVLGGGVCS